MDGALGAGAGVAPFPTGFPQAPQNFFPGVRGFPQDGQAGTGGGAMAAGAGGASAGTGRPQDPQNFFPGVSELPQDGQVNGDGDMSEGTGVTSMGEGG